MAEANPQGLIQREYIYLNQQPLALIDYTGTGETFYYYHNDHLGTPQKLSNEAQDIVWEASYTPFGEANISVETVTQSIRFPGQYFDRETDLHYNWNRYYDPKLGRYITSDPIGLTGGINTYGYANQNPIMNIDPDGLIWSRLLDLIAPEAAGKSVGVLKGEQCAQSIGCSLASSARYDIVTDRCNQQMSKSPYPPVQTASGVVSECISTCRSLVKEKCKTDTACNMQ